MRTSSKSTKISLLVLSVSASVLLVLFFGISLVRVLRFNVLYAVDDNNDDDDDDGSDHVDPCKFKNNTNNNKKKSGYRSKKSKQCL